MKRLLLFLLFPFLTNAQLTLSNQAEISIITCGPTQTELYSAFGHSAVRVKDPINSLDVVFNYGVFDFDQPNFYLNFTRGNLLYKLSVGHFPSFRDYYISENRFIHAQLLNLDSAQSQKYFDFLQWNAQPENADYLYDYFYDNCATRIREGLIEVFGSNITIDSNYTQGGKTIRELCDMYLKEQAWGDLGIDICLGLPMDKKASAWEYMFLPDYLEKALRQAKIKESVQSQEKNLVNSRSVIFASQGGSSNSPLLNPYAAFALILLLAIFFTVYSYQQPRKARFFDFTLFIILGLVGFLLFVLWFFTNHQAAANNFNLLVFLPTHVILAFALFKKSWSSLTKILLKFTPYYYAVLTAVWIWLPQELHLAFMPLCAVLILRTWHLSYKDQRAR
jgi:hypothetical protein